LLAPKARAREPRAPKEQAREPDDPKRRSDEPEAAQGIIQMRPAGNATRFCILLFLLNFCGCTQLGYYAQSVRGQLDIWRREKPIEAVIDDHAAPQTLRDKLALVLKVREFASAELALPRNGSYRRYADLQRPYVVWNVFAAAEFSTQPVQWCFAMAGCVNYRGYFAKDDADAFAVTAAAQGHDIYVGGVPAYSTLGWFADPVLNTFVHYPPAELARLIFHELSHQVVYVKDDTIFNESFAVTVEREGVKR
jgi:predicted aminopeptidase